MDHLVEYSLKYVRRSGPWDISVMIRHVASGGGGRGEGGGGCPHPNFLSQQRFIFKNQFTYRTGKVFNSGDFLEEILRKVVLFSCSANDDKILWNQHAWFFLFKATQFLRRNDIVKGAIWHLGSSMWTKNIMSSSFYNVASFGFELLINLSKVYIVKFTTGYLFLPKNLIYII